MSNGYWMTFGGQVEDKQKFRVRYSTPTIGFTVDKEVTEEVQRMLMVAFEAGKMERSAELRKLLGVSNG